MLLQSARPRWRIAYASTAAALCWFALLLQLALSIRLSLDDGGSVLLGVWMYFAFFTVLTNLLAALALTWPVAAPNSSAGRFFARADIITGIATSIALVGIAYNLLLRHTWNPQGLQKLADELLHDVMPAAFVLYWWFAARTRSTRFARIGYWALYPIVYFVYAMLRGALTGFYPYPFIDVASLGYLRALENAIAVLIGFVFIAAVLISLGRIGVRKSSIFK